MKPNITDIGFLTKPATNLIDLILSNIDHCCKVNGDDTSDLSDMLNITKLLNSAKESINAGERVSALDAVNTAITSADCDYLKSIHIGASKFVEGEHTIEVVRTLLIYQIQQELMMLRQLLIP